MSGIEPEALHDEMPPERSLHSIAVSLARIADLMQAQPEPVLNKAGEVLHATGIRNLSLVHPDAVQILRRPMAYWRERYAGASFDGFKLLSELGLVLDEPTPEPLVKFTDAAPPRGRSQPDPDCTEEHPDGKECLNCWIPF